MRAGARAVAATFLLGFAVPAPAQVNPGRLAGTVADEAGQPVTGAKLKLTQEESAKATALELKLDKNGKFSHAFFPSGSYRVTLDDPSLALKSMVYVLMDVSGIEHERKQVDAHPTEGLIVQVPAGQRVELILVARNKDATGAAAPHIEARGKLEKPAALYAAGDMEGVVEATGKLLATEPDLGGALYLQGAALARLGRLAEAEESLQHAVKIVPEQPGIWQLLGTVLLDRSAEATDAGAAAALADEAAQFFEEDLARNPGSVKSLTNRAVALEKAGKTAESESALVALIEADPTNEKARSRLATRLYNVAAGLFNEGKHEEALSAARRAVEIDPKLPEPHRLLALIHVARNDEVAAIAELETYLELAPDGAATATERQLLDSLKKKQTKALRPPHAAQVANKEAPS